MIRRLTWWPENQSDGTGRERMLHGILLGRVQVADSWRKIDLIDLLLAHLDRVVNDGSVTESSLV
jgi:hypothetical protein